jgi:hypothetical protein
MNIRFRNQKLNGKTIDFHFARKISDYRNDVSERYRTPGEGDFYIAQNVARSPGALLSHVFPRIQ